MNRKMITRAERRQKSDNKPAEVKKDNGFSDIEIIQAEPKEPDPERQIPAEIPIPVVHKPEIQKDRPKEKPKSLMQIEEEKRQHKRELAKKYYLKNREKVIARIQNRRKENRKVKLKEKLEPAFQCERKERKDENREVLLFLCAESGIIA